MTMMVVEEGDDGWCDGAATEGRAAAVRDAAFSCAILHAAGREEDAV